MRQGQLTEVARYRVLFDDCDPMRIMYYGSYFRLFEIGWTELLRRLGLPLPVYIARGLYLAVIDLTCRYIKPARYDDLLAIRAGLIDMSAARFEIHYEIVATNGDLLASGRTLHAVLNEASRPQRVPDEFLHLARTAIPQRPS